LGNVLTTDQKGAVAELEIARQAADLGIGVWSAYTVERYGLVRRSYSSDEIDAFAACCPETDRCYFLPLEIFENRTAIQLRLRPARNNQAARINWARDYEFAAKLGCLGAVAQLGERRAGSA
jgi:PD-(D/E)XK endonuclease